MLSDTMKKINEAEQKAQGTVQDAKNKAAQIVEAAREQAKQNLADAKAAAQEEAKAALARAEKEGEDEKEKYASEVKVRIGHSVQQALEKADKAVDVIVSGLV